MKQHLLIILMTLLGSMLLAQDDSSEDVAFYADVMINAEKAKHRITAAKKFEALLSEVLAEENSFNNSLDDLPFIFVRYPDDRSFRTITWQLDKGGDRYEYDGLIQLADNSTISMAGKRGRAALDPIGSIGWSQWKGGLIYKILTTGTGANANNYLLTYRQLNQYTKAKTVEHIAITDDKITLAGTPVFSNPESTQPANRLVLQYSADSNCSIRYQVDNQQLVYDNLVGAVGRITGQGPTYIPDGSYKAYVLQHDGSWEYVDKLFKETFATPPRGGISTSGKDILGRGKN